MRRILFVCTGNICRSPLAEALLRKKLEGAADGIVVDSAGLTPDHVGQQADSRMRSTAQRRGVTVDHRSREFVQNDFEKFDLIVAMDDGHLRRLARLRRDGSAGVRKMLEFDPTGPTPAPDVPDPWYGDMEGFERVYEMVDRATTGLAELIQRENG